MAIPPYAPVIGLVGGVGSGKSSVANHLSSRIPIEVIDGDAAGHRVLAEARIKEQIRHKFGDSVFSEDGDVDRSALGKLVFGQTPEQRQARQDLEQLVHPRIKELLSEQIDRSRRSETFDVIFLDAAVLFEAGWNDLCDLVVFVDTPLSIRQRRVSDSRGWSEDDLSRRESSQWPLERKLQNADQTIDNSGSLDHASRQLEQIVKEYLENGDERDDLE